VSNTNIQVQHTTKQCIRCGENGLVTVFANDLIDYLHNNKHVQNAFPYLDAGEREQIMTGTHPKCWEKMFPEEDEDEQSE
jgi:hypothetical protein